MKQKRYLSRFYSRQGWEPDTVVLRPVSLSAEECRRELERENRCAHYHLSSDGTVTALAPLTSAQTPPTAADGYPYCYPVSEERRAVLILIQTDGDVSTAQREQIKPLLKQLRKERYKTYGSDTEFFFRDETGSFGEKELQTTLAKNQIKHLYRVQTGCYLERRRAEESLERLREAGIAGYITAVRRDGTEELI